MKFEEPIAIKEHNGPICDNGHPLDKTHDNVYNNSLGAGCNKCN